MSETLSRCTDGKSRDIFIIYVTVFGKINRLARKTNFFFIALLPFTSNEDAAIQI